MDPIIAIPRLNASQCEALQEGMHVSSPHAFVALNMCQRFPRGSACHFVGHVFIPTLSFDVGPTALHGRGKRFNPPVRKMEARGPSCQEKTYNENPRLYLETLIYQICWSYPNLEPTVCRPWAQAIRTPGFMQALDPCAILLQFLERFYCWFKPALVGHCKSKECHCAAKMFTLGCQRHR